MHPYVIPLSENLLILGCALFAYREGGIAERIGSVWLACNTIVGSLLLVLRVDSLTTHLVADGVFATGLLPLAVIFASYWVGLVTLAASALFALEAVYLINDWPIDRLFANVNNGLAIAIPLVILCSGLANRRRRRRLAAANGRPGSAGAALI
ncbi:hypothetical protein LJR225_002660 [Phenylobacterium sp. LjRoot225]|uniref:hypothetical protein n=1 Tax=Phenylobacterium sp. LjRoot225 TaxID=3342285 RepID=UPI003ED01E49